MNHYELPTIDRRIELFIPTDDKRKTTRAVRGKVVGHYPNHISILLDRINKRESFTNKEILKGIITYKYI